MIHIKTTHHPFGSNFSPTCTTRCLFILLTCLPVSLVACLFCSPLLSCCFWPPVSSLTPVLLLCASCSASWGSFFHPFCHKLNFFCFCLFLSPSPLPLSPQVTLPSSSETPGDDASFQLLLSLCSSCTLCPLFLPAPNGSEGQGSNSRDISHYFLHEMTVRWDPAFSRWFGFPSLRCPAILQIQLHHF